MRVVSINLGHHQTAKLFSPLSLLLILLKLNQTPHSVPHRNEWGTKAEL